MAAAGIDAAIVHGRGVVGEYGAIQYLAGFFPNHKGVYVVAPRSEAPTVVAATEADGRWIRSRVVAETDVVWPDSPSREAYLRTVAVLAQETSRGGMIGLAGSGAGLPADDSAILIGLLEKPPRRVDEILLRAKSKLEQADEDGIRAAVASAERGLEAFARGARAGMTEWEAASLIEQRLRSDGARATLVHVTAGPFFGQSPEGSRISQGDLITVLAELVSADGYWVEVGGLFGCGELSSEARALAASCISSLGACGDLISAGRRSADVAGRLVDRIHEEGGEPVVGLGHGVGVDEGPPTISVSDPGRIDAGTALAMHPSIEISGMATAVANTYLIGANGAIPLSRYPETLREVPAG